MTPLIHFLVTFGKGFAASLAMHFTAILALFTVEWACHQAGHLVGIILMKLMEG